MQIPPDGSPASGAQSSSSGKSEVPGRVVCLCARWCDLCRDYAAVFQEIGRRFPALAFRWIDIEDEADLTGEMEVETFPTLIVADALGRLVFAGPLAPQPGVLERLVLSACMPGSAPAARHAEASALLQRLQEDDSGRA